MGKWGSMSTWSRSRFFTLNMFWVSDNHRSTQYPTGYSSNLYVLVSGLQPGSDTGYLWTRSWWRKRMTPCPSRRLEKADWGRSQCPLQFSVLMENSLSRATNSTVYKIMDICIFSLSLTLLFFLHKGSFLLPKIRESLLFFTPTQLKWKDATAWEGLGWWS